MTENTTNVPTQAQLAGAAPKPTKKATATKVTAAPGKTVKAAAAKPTKAAAPAVVAQTKSTKKAAPPKVEAKVEAKTETKGKGKGESKSEIKFHEDGRRLTLRNPQIEILKLLAANPNGLSRKTLAEKVKTSITEMVGSLDGHPNKYTVTLVEQKMAKQEEVEGEGIWVTITPAGKKAVEAIK
jgi:hypothetical protein